MLFARLFDISSCAYSKTPNSTRRSASPTLTSLAKRRRSLPETPSIPSTSVGKRMRFGMRRSNRNSTTTTAASWRPLAPSYFPGATPSLSKTHTFSCESWRTGLQSVLQSVLRSGLPKPLLYINQRIEDVLHATLFWRRQESWVGRERPPTSRVAPGQLCSVPASSRAAFLYAGFHADLAAALAKAPTNNLLIPTRENCRACLDPHVN